MKINAARILIVLALFLCVRARADVVLVDTGAPDGRMASASRPGSTGIIEIETADDFILPCDATINSATFTGLLPSSLSLDSVQQVVVEIYRIFPLDSDTVRTIKVPTRANSPSDVAFDSRDSSANELTFTPTVLASTLTALNSVQPGGIHPSPLQTTGGNGAVTGEEVLFQVTFTSPFSLPAGHYFFVPQVGLSSGDFYWLSAAGPTVAGDLQSWTRDENLAPDWLRIGTDIVGGATPPKFNASFSLSGAITALGVLASGPNPLGALVGAPIAPVTFSATGGTGPFTFSETGSLAGLTFDASGVLSGTPTQLGNFPITVTATGANGCTGTLLFTIQVTCGTLPTVSASSSNPLLVNEGAPIAPVTFSATGGTGPFTFSETGSLPGLSFDASGVLSGTPTQLGDFPITVTATDANGCSGTLAFTIRVFSAEAAAGLPTLTPGALALLALAVAGAGMCVLRR